MAPKLILPLAALVMASACAASTQAPAPGVRPALTSYRVGATRPVRLTAPYGGYLTQQGQCLGLLVQGRFAAIIWPETARLSFDGRGLVLAEGASGATLRLGDYLQGTGGPLPPGTPHSIGDDILTESFPIECARWRGYDGWIGIVNPGFAKAQPPGP